MFKFVLGSVEVLGGLKVVSLSINVTIFIQNSTVLCSRDYGS